MLYERLRLFLQTAHVAPAVETLRERAVALHCRAQDDTETLEAVQVLRSARPVEVVNALAQENSMEKQVMEGRLIERMLQP